MKPNKNIPIIISIIFLSLAILARFPYGFYTLLRLIVCGTTAYLAWLAYECKKQSWVWSFGFIAVLFNPLIPIHLDIALWRIIDLMVAVFLAISIFTFKLPKEVGE
jgi:hypothetical protein